MAFSSLLRRAGSSLSPLLLRSLSTPTPSLSPLSLLRPSLPSLPSLSPLSLLASHFSSLTKPSADSELLRVIESEIKCAEECDDHDRTEEIPDGFPFEISDEKGMNVITLTREYQGKEKVEVLVSMPSIVTGEEPEHEGEEGEGEEGSVDSQPNIPITVTVSKEGAGPTLEFACTAYPDQVVIDSLSVREDREDGEEMIAYEGPDFNDLDDNLQKAFHKYLELRGITPRTTNFLHEYMINKDSREYLLWLRNLKDFIAK